MRLNVRIAAQYVLKNSVVAENVLSLRQPNNYPEEKINNSFVFYLRLNHGRSPVAEFVDKVENVN